MSKSTRSFFFLSEAGEQRMKDSKKRRQNCLLFYEI